MDKEININKFFIYFDDFILNNYFTIRYSVYNYHTVNRTDFNLFINGGEYKISIYFHNNDIITKIVIIKLSIIYCDSKKTYDSKKLADLYVNIYYTTYSELTEEIFYYG